MKKYTLISLISGLVLIFFFYYFIGFKKIFSSFSLLKGWQIVLLVLLSLAGLFLNIKRYQLVTRDFGGFRPSLRKTSKIWLTGFALTYLTPTGHFGGEPIKALGLSKEYNYPYPESLLTTVIEQVVSFLGIAFFALSCACLLFFKKYFTLSSLVFLWFLFIVLAIYISMRLWKNEKFFDYLFKVFFLHKIKVKTENGLQTLSSEIKRYGNQAINYIRKHQPRFLLSCFYSFCYSLVWILIAKLFFLFLGTNISFEKLFFLKVMVDIAYSAPLPASIGAFEGAHFFVFNLFGLSVGSALAFSLLMRSFDTVYAGLGLYLGTRATAKSTLELLKGS